MTEFSIPDFIKNPQEYVKQVSIEEIMEFLHVANEYYRNESDTLIPDELYDWLEAYARKKNPKHPFFKKIGAPVKEKVELPVWMGSLDKIRDNPKAITTWMNKYKAPYVISEKLDGNSGLFALNKSKMLSLYTRGDGAFGQNITSLLPYLQKDYGSVDSMWSLKELNKTKEYPLLVRGELIMSKKSWEEVKHKGSNARNIVAGALNAKTPDIDIAKRLEFVAYELVEPRMPFYEGLQFLQKIGFNVVYHRHIAPEELTNDILSKYLLQRRKDSLYEIDGVVVRDDIVHPIVRGNNPKYAFAYKTILTHEEAEVVVLKVEWNVSKDGLIKPTVHFNPVYINNVKIQKASGFNGEFIQKHKIGVGSKIAIIRSGDVIPHIQRVITPSATGQPSMPTIPYEWTDTHVDIRIKQGKENEDMKLRQLEHFVNTLNVKFVGEGILKKMFQHGITTIPKFLAVQKKDLLLLEGIQEKGAEKIYQSIQESYKNTNCTQLMVASNLFGRGFGEKRIKAILQENPEILQQKLITKLQPVEGVGKVIEAQFLENLPLFYAFLDSIGYTCSPKVPEKERPSSSVPQVFKDMTLVFTGFRNKDWEAKIEELGGKLGSSVSKKTSMVVAADKEDDSAKVVKAKELGIVLYSKEEFVAKYKKHGFS